MFMWEAHILHICRGQRSISGVVPQVPLTFCSKTESVTDQEIVAGTNPGDPLP